MKNELKTLTDAIRYFADEQVCIATVAAMRWPNGPVCPACESGHLRQHWLKNQKRWQCRECGKQYSVKVNTIFEDSAIKLDKWLTAMWMLANCKNGVSSYEIARSVGVTQKSAWFMLHRIREAMKSGSFVKLGGDGGEVEADEAFIGGKFKNMHKKRRNALQKLRAASLQGNTNLIGKTTIVGMLDRKQRKVRATVVTALDRDTIHGEILKHVARGSKLYTDEAGHYLGLPKSYTHAFVSHLEKYVDGRVHTNGIENFWSLLKRGLNGTYIAVEPFHLARYVDEQVFRYNHRKDEQGNKVPDADRFYLALSQIAGKRLTYAEVTGKVGETAN